jgi:hypothetical protein
VTDRDALGRFIKALEAHRDGPGFHAGAPAPTLPGAEHLIRRVPRGDPLPDLIEAKED